MFEPYSMYIIGTVKRQAKSCDPKNKNSGAKHNAIHILRVQIVFTILYTFLKKHDKIQHVLPA